ncbi:MAG: C40 family peptidase [Bacteroidota bacterium]|nr:C40 family peptidase [Bacteroidota bacterium]
MKNSILKFLLNFVLVLFFGMIVSAQHSNFKALNVAIQTLQKQLVPDKRVAILDVSIADTLKSPVTVRGETNLPEGESAVLELLKNQGIHFADSIKVFPVVSLGEKTWGLVTLSVINLRSQPDHPAEMVSQALMGTPLKVLESLNGWYHVQTPDQYLGWMEGNGLVSLTSDEMDRWKKSDRFVYNRISGKAMDSPNRKGMAVTDLVLGDLFEKQSEVKGFLKIRLPDGRTGFVRKSECISWLEWTTRKPDVQAMISIARQMLGTPYLWGGTSTKGVDCSGFTKNSYYSQGIILARDASQQARYGEHPDFNNMEALQPGDLLFFGRNAQRVTHVGLYMGNGKFIHSSGLVRINSLDPNDPVYNETLKKKLVASGRILNSLNTEGIMLVKDHPWYNSLPQTPSVRRRGLKGSR